MNLLVVEDEKNLGETLSEYLSSLGYDTDWAQTAEQARKMFLEKRPTVVILDVGLPDGNGFELAQEWREKNKSFVLLFLTAMNDPNSRVQGLEIGAEDYITKPFELKELTLRLERILANHESSSQELVFGKLKVWFSRYEVQDGAGKILSLSQKECAILKLLLERANEVVPRDEILEKVWGNVQFPSNRTVDNYIVKLRKWMETDEGLQIVSVRGIGYKVVL